MTRRQLLGSLGGIFLAGLSVNKAEGAQVPSDLHSEINRAVKHHYHLLRKKGLAARVGLSLDEWVAVTHAIVRHESAYRPDAVNLIPAKEVESIGLMQINFGFWRKTRLLEGVSKELLFDPYWNVRIGLVILTENLLRYRSLDKALYRYVGGADSRYVVNVLQTAFLLKGGRNFA